VSERALSAIASVSSVIAPVEMPWWSWLLIWGGLLLALVALLAVFAWLLFRKFLVLMDDLGALAEKTAILGMADTDPVLPRHELAVLADYREVRARREQRVRRAVEARRLRHVRRMARARAITTVDPSTVEWPAAWYDK
jgi:hypothetical protein